MDLIKELAFEELSISNTLNREFLSYCKNLYQIYCNLLPFEKVKNLRRLEREICPPRLFEILSSPQVSAVLRYITSIQFDDEIMTESYEQLYSWLEWEGPGKGTPGTTSCDGKLKLTVHGQKDRNPTLMGTSTIVDFDSEGIWTHLDAGISKFEKYQSHERDSIEFGFNSVNRLLDKFHVLRRFIDLNTQIVHIRKTPERSNIGSSTNILRIGATCLRNIDLGIHDPILILDLILHENIHNFLGKYEVLYGYFVNPNSKDMVESPWTGNIIPIQAYTQACYVWFGLWQYYKILLSEYEATRIHPKIALAKMGIIKGLENPIRGMSGFSNKFIEDLRKIEHEVRINQ